jgi:large subunit ribosomal protein L15
LRAAGLVNGREVRVKVLGVGDLGRKVTVRAHAFSASAKSKIEEAGGAAEVIDVRGGKGGAK